MLKFFQRLPRWMVFQIDVLIVLVSIFFAYYLRFNFKPLPESVWLDLTVVIPIVVGIKIILFYVTKSYAGIIRYTSIIDAKRIFEALTYSLVIFLLINIIYNYNTGKPYFIPISILLIDYFVSMLFMTAFRIVAKIIYYEWKHYDARKINVIIYGAGEAGMITRKTLYQDVGTNYNVVAFVDDDPSKEKKTLDGVEIKHSSKLEKLIEEKKAEMLILSIQNIDPIRKRELIEQSLSYGIHVRNVPPVDKWINGELSFGQIKDVRIEDVLGREQIQLDDKQIAREINNKVVMITGAAGSIGSELVRQVNKYSPHKIVAIDQAESPLYDLEMELREKHFVAKFQTLVADITDLDRMEEIFSTQTPDIIFHAAAYKHVPLMEENPSEAINTNVRGTRIIADLAVKNNVKKFVMVSTDKAVNPTSVMGASKRIAEIYIQSLNKKVAKEDKVTRFVTTRFGNVLGSNGSVIPRFRKQISEGGPVTVTHPDITRYFMTIPEACQLVLDAGSMGKGGEIFLFDMGKSIKIVDLAKKMIKLSGLELGKDIQLVYTGLRPGEKLYEELLADQENTKPTHNPKIMIAQVREYEFMSVTEQITDLINSSRKHDAEIIVGKMKDIIPEYISNNSVFEKLDSKPKIA